MIAKRGDTLQPINSPTSCKYNFVLYVKYALLNTVSSILCKSTNLSPRRTQLYRNAMIMVIRIKREASVIMIIGNYVWQKISVFLDRVLE